LLLLENQNHWQKVRDLSRNLHGNLIHFLFRAAPLSSNFFCSLYFNIDKMTSFLLLALLAIVSVYFASGCVSGSCYNGMCKDIPADNTYYLTSFCDKSVACGSFSGDCNEYYAADYARFGCGAISKCLNPWIAQSKHN
jgi:hypothetical protein